MPSTQYVDLIHLYLWLLKLEKFEIDLNSMILMKVDMNDDEWNHFETSAELPCLFQEHGFDAQLPIDILSPQ